MESNKKVSTVVKSARPAKVKLSLYNHGNAEGLFWPRGSGNSYIFGEGLWFATKKEIQGKRRKLCDLGYNPNSGAGWYIEGEVAPAECRS